MEEDLDKIARGQSDRLTVMREFYQPFKATVDQALAAAAKERQPAAKVAKATRAKREGGRGGGKKAKAQPTSPKEGQACPLCKEGILQVKSGKFGAFLGCSRYALGCQYTENIGSKGKSFRKRTARKSRTRSK
jgi:hypothetical protein